jgi:hypothetical protein
MSAETISTVPVTPLPHSQQGAELNNLPIKTITTEKPVVVQETIHPVEKIQVQPVIYREREQLEVHQVTQRLHQTHILSPKVERQILEPQYTNSNTARQLSAELEEVRAQALARDDVENVEIVEEEGGITRIRIIKKAIVQENQRRQIVEEVQPIIVRDTLSTQQREMSGVELPYFEKIVMVPMRFRFRGQVDFASFTLDQPFDVPTGQIMSVEELYRLQSFATRGPTEGYVPYSTQQQTFTSTTSTMSSIPAQPQQFNNHNLGQGITTSVTALPQGGAMRSTTATNASLNQPQLAPF